MPIVRVTLKNTGTRNVRQQVEGPIACHPSPSSILAETPASQTTSAPEAVDEAGYRAMPQGHRPTQEQDLADKPRKG